MIDGNILITIVPPIFAALIAYAIARIKSNANERIQRAKIEAEVDGKAMEMVKNVMEEMRRELKAEISLLREENKALRITAESNRDELENLRGRLRESAELQDAMKIEIASLKNTIQWYERRLRESETGEPAGDKPD
jgi:predicted RNase H-like nuclease (RuvC/YqgF family)